MKSRLFFYVGVFLFAISIIAVACAYGTPSEMADQQRVNRQQEIYANNQPIPVYDYSLPRDVLIQIYTAKNLATSTTTVFFSNSGVPLYACPSRGFPIEGGTELTNPNQISYTSYSNSSYGYGVIGQADPDGLFHPSNAAGTYVLCVRPNGDVVPIYSEPMVMTFPFEVQVKDGKIVNVDTSPSTSKIRLDKTAHILPTFTPTPHP